VEQKKICGKGGQRGWGKGKRGSKNSGTGPGGYGDGTVESGIVLERDCIVPVGQAWKKRDKQQRKRGLGNRQ